MMQPEDRPRPTLLCTDSLKVQLQDSDPDALHPVAFNQQGLTLFSLSPLEPGLQLSLRLDYASDRLQLEAFDLPTNVLECEGSEAGFQIWLGFEGAAPTETLAAIEADLQLDDDAEDRYHTGLSEFDS